MELNRIDIGELYFEAPSKPQVAALLAQAAAAYGTPEAALALEQAVAIAPDDLQVLVALYRFDYYQHRLEQALHTGEHALAVAAQRLQWPTWDQLTSAHVAAALVHEGGLARFYLLALKGVGYLYLRLGQREAGEARLRHLMYLDPLDQLGAGALLLAIYPVESTDAFPAESA